METPSPAHSKEAQMFCLLTSGELDCVFPENWEGNCMEMPTPAPPREAQMRCWLTSGEMDYVFLEKYKGDGMETPTPASPLGKPECFAG